MFRKVTIVVCVLSVFSLAACKKSEEGQQAEVRAAIENYLKSRPGLAWDQMTMEVNKVQISGDTAEADVTFNTKSGEAAMGFHYSLKREGGRWAVIGGRGGGMGLPAGHPPIGPQGAPAPGMTGTSPGPASPQPATPAPKKSH